MSYDHWKTRDDTPMNEFNEEEQTELDLVYEQLYAMRMERDDLVAANDCFAKKLDALLAAAKAALWELSSLNRAFMAFQNTTVGPADNEIPRLQAAIAHAEELAP